MVELIIFLPVQCVSDNALDQTKPKPQDHIFHTMNYLTSLFFILFAVSLVNAQSVEFNVDLNGSGYPTNKSNSIRIAANPNGVWQGDYINLTDDDGDGIYTGLVLAVPAGDLLFRVFEGPANSTGWVGNFISDITPIGCMSLEKEEANYKIEVVKGRNMIVSFKLNECLTFNDTKNIQPDWMFNTLQGWTDGSQNMDGLENYSIEDGILKFHTRANTWDRPKVKTLNNIYNEGKYVWRTYVLEMGVGDMASIGAFLYSDDTHELDFEIGYGSEEVRKELDAESDDLLIYMTSQGEPFESIPKKIKRNEWYDLELVLTETDGKYLVVWSINGDEFNRLKLNYGKEVSFYIFCSVENLKFIGDHIPAQVNSGWFDSVIYKSFKTY